MSGHSRTHPVTEQPGRWASSSSGSVGKELEAFRHMDFVRIKQELEWCEICCCNCCETENKYKIMNAQGETMFSVKEESNCCCRYCCGAERPFDIFFKDDDDNELLKIDRPVRCQASCCFCCLQTIGVYAPVDNKIGSVDMKCGITRPQFDVNDADGNAVLQIEGPCAMCNVGSWDCCCSICCCRTVGFEILRDDEKIGMIRKEFSGVAKEMTTDADNFYVTFPQDLDINLKLTLISAVFLLDYMYFEKSPPDAPDGSEN